MAFEYCNPSNNEVQPWNVDLIAKIKYEGTLDFSELNSTKITKQACRSNVKKANRIKIIKVEPKAKESVDTTDRLSKTLRIIRTQAK